MKVEKRSPRCPLCSECIVERGVKGESVEDAGCNCFRCVECGCLEYDHILPDWYDPRTESAYCAGKLNWCGDCANCYILGYTLKCARRTDLTSVVGRK